MKLKPYPKYKESGIQWIGKIPEGWEVRKLKHICTKYAEYGLNISSDNYKTEGIRFIRTTDIDDYGNLENGGVYLNKSLCKGYTLNSGDLLISRSGTIGRTFIFNSDKNGEATYAGYLVRFSINRNKAIPKYIFYFTKTNSFYGWLEIQSIETTIKNVNGQKYANLLLAIPPIPDQTAIANFLDKKTVKINTLIEKNKKLIALLKEKRTALINHAVTKGLGPNAKMKDSGIHWIGEIPEGWEVKKIKFVSNKVITGKTPPTDNYVYYDNGNINWFTPSDLGDNLILKKSSRKITPLAILKNKVNKYNPNTVLLVGIGATLGKVGIITDTGTSNQQINAIEFNEIKLYPPYGLYYLYGYKDALISLSNASTIGIFNQTQTANFIIIVPPLPDQTAIANYLDKATAKIDKTIKLIEKKILLLQKYKKSLIHHVVTGKVDVREVED